MQQAERLSVTLTVLVSDSLNKRCGGAEARLETLVVQGFGWASNASKYIVKATQYEVLCSYGELIVEWTPNIGRLRRVGACIIKVIDYRLTTLLELPESDDQSYIAKCLVLESHFAC